MIDVPTFKKAFPEAIKKAKKQEEEVTESLIKSISVTEGLDDSDIELILREHAQNKASEAAAFKDYRWLDDLINATTITDRNKYGLTEGKKLENKLLDKRRDELTKINNAIDGATDRQKRLFTALGKHNDKKGSDAYKEASKLAFNMTNHIPDSWLLEYRSRGKKGFINLCKSQSEREAIVEENKNVPEKKRQEERKLFEEMIEHGSLKGMDRTQFFFDKPTLSLTPEMNTRLMKTYDEILKRAYAIHDAGGTCEEVEESLEHLPPEFWPPAFIRSLQAWRKVERELAEERVKAMFDKKGPGGIKEFLGDVKGSLDFAMDTLGFVGLATDLGGFKQNIGDTGKIDPETGEKIFRATAGEAFVPCAWRGAPGEVEATAAFIGVLQGGWGFGEDVYKAFKDDTIDELVADRDDLDGLPDRIAQANNKLAGELLDAGQGNLTKVGGGIGLANNIGWGMAALDKATIFNDYIPVLCVVAAGIDLTNSLINFGRAMSMRGKTSSMLDEAKIDSITGKSKDGGALVKAIKNEMGARTRQISKTGVEVTGKTLTLAGEITLTATEGTGVGAGVGLGLKVAGKSVEYGNKIVFAGIDWGIARNAKELIFQAQAGNPIARMQIMEDSGLYAKMYICMLAKEGNPMATKFIVQRGITESDLRKPSMALSVLREAMLAHAEQKDETKVSDNPLEVIGDEFGFDSVTNLGKTLIVKPVTKIKDFIVDKSRESAAAKYKYKPKWAVPKFPSDPEEWSQHWSDTKTEAKKVGLYATKTVFRTGLKDALSSCAKSLAACKGFIDAAEKARETDDPSANFTYDKAKAIKEVQKVINSMSKVSDLGIKAHPERNEGGLHEPMARYICDVRSTISKKQTYLEVMLIDVGVKDSNWGLDPDYVGEKKEYYGEIQKKLDPDGAPLITKSDEKPEAKLSKAPDIDSDAWEKAWASAVDTCSMPKDDEGVSKALTSYRKAKEDLGKDDISGKDQRKARMAIRKYLKEAAAALKNLQPVTTSFEGLYKYIEETIKLVLKTSRENEEELNKKWSDVPAHNFSEEAWKKLLKGAREQGFIGAYIGNDAKKALAGYDKAKAKLDELGEDFKRTPKARKARDSVLKELAKVNGETEKLIARNLENHEDLLGWFIFVNKQVGVIAQKIFNEQNAIDFTPDDTLSKGGWENTYRTATSCGAVATTKKKSVLSKALAKLDQCRADVSKATSYAKRYQAAKKLDKIVPEIHQAISKVQEARGYTDQETMANYLLEMRDTVGELRNDEKEPFKSVLSGKDAPKPFKNGQKIEFVWSNSKSNGGWQDIKKKADAAGLIKKSKNKTGVGGAIVSISEQEKAIEKATKKGKSNQETGALVIKIVVTLTTLNSALTKLKEETENLSFSNYLEDALKVTKERLEKYETEKLRLIGGADASFDPVKVGFKWYNKGSNGWQDVKKVASDADLFVYKVKTGFGTALDKSEKLRDTAEKTRLTKNKKQNLDQEIETLELVLTIAERLKEGTLNNNFRDYFEQGIQQAKTRKTEAFNNLKDLN